MNEFIGHLMNLKSLYLFTLVEFNLFVNALYSPAKILPKNFRQIVLALHINFLMEEIGSKLGIVFCALDG